MDEGIKLRPPGSINFVDKALSKTGRLISRDVFELYAATGGMNVDGNDSNLFSLWNLNRVIDENSRARSEDLLFGDFSLDSHFYCFRYESIDRSSVWIDHFDYVPPEKVADSVAEFFELMLKDPKAVGL
jgi:hypothetical protein